MRKTFMFFLVLMLLMVFSSTALARTPQRQGDFVVPPNIDDCRLCRTDQFERRRVNTTSGTQSRVSLFQTIRTMRSAR